MHNSLNPARLTYARFCAVIFLSFSWDSLAEKYSVCMHRDDDGTPLTARRFASLAGSGGDDDMFSDSFTEQQLQVPLTGLLQPLPFMRSRNLSS